MGPYDWVEFGTLIEVQACAIDGLPNYQTPPLIKKCYFFQVPFTIFLKFKNIRFLNEDGMRVWAVVTGGSQRRR